MKKLFALILTLAMLVSVVPVVPVYAAEITDTNPLYGPGQIPVVHIAPQLFNRPTQVCRTQEAAAAYVRSMMSQRVSAFTVRVPKDMYHNMLMLDIFEMALEHTGNPKEGDSIRWQWVERRLSASSAGEYIDLKYDMIYHTSAQEEAELDAAVDALLIELGCSAADPYGSLVKIYDWMCANITYDYDHLYDQDYLHKFTAYAAMIHRTSVCQGYALLMYQFALKLGIDCRFVSGIGNGGPHGWNIIKMGDYYYNLDATWDAERMEYAYFLKGSENFPDHERDAEYTTDQFNALYPMDVNDFQMSGDHCANGHTWYGNLCTELLRCFYCGALGTEYGPHRYNAVTCTEPKTCAVCGETEGEALNHTPKAGGCKDPVVCQYCGEILADAPGHVYSDQWDTECDKCNRLRLFFCEDRQIRFEIYASSEEPYTLTEGPEGVALHLEGCEWENGYCWHTYSISGVGIGAYDLKITHATDNASSSFTLQVIPHNYVNGWCNICGHREEQAHTHTWLAASCVAPQTCVTCGATEGEPSGHTWLAANCTAPQTCVTCGATEGEPSGHTWLAANCTAPQTCVTCGATEGEPSAHTWLAANCTAPQTCVTCGATEGEPSGHTWLAANCTAPQTCVTCGVTEGEPTGHTWADASCDTPKTCSVCAATEGDALEHNWIDATCETEKTCATCMKTEGAALGHKWDDGEVTKPATETEEGVKTYTCTVCDQTKTEPIPAVEHTHNYEKSSIAATCDTDGYDQYTCASCGDSYTDNLVEAFGHIWIEANCETAKTCELCNKTEGEALGHQWAYASCDNPKTCTNCGNTEGEALGHEWVDATCETAKICERCNITEGEALGHKYANGFCSVCGKENIVASGSITETMSWKLDSEGKLTVTGSGEMDLGEEEPVIPWAAYNDQILCVVIEEGVTSIADNAFAECMKLEEVTLAETIETVGKCAFANCEKLKTIEFQGEAPALGENCFQGVSARVTHPALDSWKEDTLVGTGGDMTLEPAKPNLMKGDANGDGKIDYKDAMLVLRASVGLETLSEDAKAAGDVDGNSKLDYKDAMKILRASVGLEEL